MILYLAGCGGAGNLRPLFASLLNSKNMELFLASVSSRNRDLYLAGNKPYIDEIMDLYLTGNNGGKKIVDDLGKNLNPCACLKDVNILESFFDNIEGFMPLYKRCRGFMLDSGAFSFMRGRGGKVNFDDYLERYAVFINKYDVKLFFELDIDSIVGISEVERMRHKLEVLTGKKPIPVWHKNRGKEYFIKMCENYPYVSIGGIVTQEIPRNEYEKAFPWFIKTAHQYGVKIHGLGYTNLQGLRKYHFDSVDSTAWLSGSKFGAIYRFDGKNLQKYNKPENKRVSARMTAANNFIEWVKFSKYVKDKYK